MMGLPGEIKFGHDIPKTKEGIVERIEALKKHTPISWLGTMARQSELDACRKKLEELNDGA
jgi:hypothetical protein